MTSRLPRRQTTIALSSIAARFPPVSGKFSRARAGVPYRKVLRPQSSMVGTCGLALASQIFDLAFCTPI
jgi:hypothetical protein